MDRHTTHVCAVHSSHAPQSLYRKRHRTVPVYFHPSLTSLFLFALILSKNFLRTLLRKILISLFFAVTSFISLKLFPYLLIFQSSLSLLHFLHFLLFLFPPLLPLPRPIPTALIPPTPPPTLPTLVSSFDKRKEESRQYGRHALTI